MCKCPCTWTTLLESFLVKDSVKKSQSVDLVQNRSPPPPHNHLACPSCLVNHQHLYVPDSHFHLYWVVELPVSVKPWIMYINTHSSSESKLFYEMIAMSDSNNLFNQSIQFLHFMVNIPQSQVLTYFLIIC